MSFGARLFTIFEGVGIAFESIRANKVRASLTILGVAVGVFVVVAMSSAVHGINQSVAKDLESAGPTSFYIYRRPIELVIGDDDNAPWRRNPPIRLAEAEAIGRLSSVKAATPHVGWNASYKYKDRFLSSAGLDAYTANWTEVDGGDIYPGRSFTPAEAANGARVVIINEKLASELFGASDPLDKEIDVGGIPFRVIGIYHFTGSFLGKPGSSSSGDSPKAIVPLESARRYLRVSLRWIDVTVKPRADVTQVEAMDDVTALLRGMRGLKPAQPNTFALVTSDKLLEVYNGFFGVFFIIMIALSAVGLLVGGVGVVAIMMISVTERTREIGVRKALGATRATILWQFLVEAATLTSIGAAVGLVLGTATAILVRNVTPVPAETPPMAIVAALVASALTGIIFGMLPAARAARLDPVEALRHE
ncbi:MAG TPA: ABC transporter permease [Gemmatimonadaceae bacterium]|jgi:putative ABC transport system permease protein